MTLGARGLRSRQAPWPHYVGRQPDQLQTAARQVSDVDFPPAMVAVGRTARVAVVVVVPAFAVPNQGEEPTVAPVLVCLVVTIATEVPERVDPTRNVPGT